VRLNITAEIALSSDEVVSEPPMVRRANFDRHLLCRLVLVVGPVTGRLAEVPDVLATGCVASAA
jgi:hypothetical protein